MILSDLLPTLDPVLVMTFAAIFLLAGFIKGFLGIGLPAAAVGLMTLYIPPTEAIPLLWLPILGTNILQFAHAPHRREIVSEYKWFAVAIIVAIFVTSMFMADYPTAMLTVSIGVAMVIFSLNQLFGVVLPIGSGQTWQIGAGLLAGILGGLSSLLLALEGNQLIRFQTRFFCFQEIGDWGGYVGSFILLLCYREKGYQFAYCCD